MESEVKKLYELSFIIIPDIKEDEVAAHADKIKSLITGNKGEVGKEQAPQKRKLAYPIKHQRQGYFGYFHFYSNPAAVPSVHKQLLLDETLLRHLIIAVDKKQVAQMQKPTHAVLVQEKTQKTMSKEEIDKAIFKKGDAVSHTEDKKVEIEELDKKLEEIFNK